MSEEQTPAPAGVDKPFFKSKTLCAAVVATLTPIVAQAFPAVGELLRNNADLACAAVGVVFGVLRIASKGRITLT